MISKTFSQPRLHALGRIAAFSVIVCFYFAIPNARPDFTRFNAHDSESYLALSYSLVHGIGYTRSMDQDTYVPHTTFPPGVPILMMPAIAVSGKSISWLAVKTTSALVGLLGIICVWLYTKRVIHDEVGADIVALCVGFNPFYWDFSHQAMAEVPLTAWLIASLLLVDLVWRDREVQWWESCLVGCLVGLGMLIKGHAVGLIFSPLCYALCSSQEASDRRNQFKMWGLFVFGFVIPFMVWGIRNSLTDAIGFDGLNQIRMICAKNPLDPESALLTFGEITAIVINNFRYHLVHVLPSEIVPGLMNLKDWKLPGMFSLVLSVALGSLCFGRSRWQLSILSVILPISVLNLAYSAGGAERYWVPVSILMTIMITIRSWKWLVGRERRWRYFFTGTMVIVLTVNLGLYIVKHERNPYPQEGAWKQLAEFFVEVSKVDLNSKSILTPHAETFRLTTGFKSPPMSIGKAESSRDYDYVVLRVDGNGPNPPQGALCIVRIHPWGLYELAKPSRGPELITDREIMRLPYPNPN